MLISRIGHISPIRATSQRHLRCKNRAIALVRTSLTTNVERVSTVAMNGPLAGQVAVVTGVSRSKGIGAAIAVELAQHGAHLFMTGWPKYDEEQPWKEEPEEQQRLVQELHNLGVEAEWIAFDLSNPDGHRELLDAVQKRFAGANILVNNACFSVRDSMDTLDAASLDRNYALNTRAPVLLSIEFVRRFGGKTARRIISMTSGQMLGPMRGQIGYVVTKAALDAFTITFAAEIGHLGITVNAVDPGPTDSGSMTPEIQKALLPRFALGRIGQPGDAARLIAFLAGPDAAWITGQILRSRGGFE